VSFLDSCIIISCPMAPQASVAVVSTCEIRSFARINSFIVFTPVDLSDCASMSSSQLNRAARSCTGALIDRHLLPDCGRGVASVGIISPSVRLIHCPPSENTERTLARIWLRLNVSRRHLRRGERVVSCITILYSTNDNIGEEEGEPILSLSLSLSLFLSLFFPLSLRLSFSRTLQAHSLGYSSSFPSSFLPYSSTTTCSSSSSSSPLLPSSKYTHASSHMRP
jgi:hypothetical protein